MSNNRNTKTAKRFAEYVKQYEERKKDLNFFDDVIKTIKKIKKDMWKIEMKIRTYQKRYGYECDLFNEFL